MNCAVVVFHTRNPALAKAFREAQSTISVLIKGCTEFSIIESDSEIPEGSVNQNVTAELGVHLILKVTTLFLRIFFSTIKE